MRANLRTLQKLDRRLFKRVTDRHTPVLDSGLLPLSRLANRSVLWALIGVGLAAGGGRFGKRAALRGLVSVLTTSLFANQPLKRIARRRRPALLPVARRLMDHPSSFSFPSGHAASAAAFTAGVALEIPPAGFFVGVLAAGVGYSRVYFGVHYPSDVAAGAGIGLAIGLLTTRLWPLASREAAEAPRVLDPAEVPALPAGEGLTVVVNPSAGAASGEPVEEIRKELPEARIVELERSSQLQAALRELGPASLAIGVAGGDGSVNAAAEVALEIGKPLVVVPGGTLNHLARDLGISSASDSARAVQDGSAVAMDVGVIAGRPFLNTASFGGYTEFVDMREKLEEKVGKWPALFAALFKVLGASRPVEVGIDGMTRKLWMIFVGNCCYRPSGFAPTWRERLDDGKLDVRLVDASPPWGKTRLLLAVLTGTLAKTRVYEEFVAGSLKVESLAGDMRLARDGEVFDSPRRFEITKAPSRLIVYRPAG